jgi:polysaccharide export outer membrane protein
MTRSLFFVGVILLLLGACVPARKLVYLQEDDELKHRKDIARDTTLRTRELDIIEYRIQPLDLLNINFETLGDESDRFDFLAKISPQMRGGGGAGGAAALNGVLVDKEGNVEYAVLGKIHVGGLTLFQAQDSIRAVASQYIADVVVRVRMLNFRFTVLGEVNGEQTTVSSNTRITMMEAIGLTGGFGELADRSFVKVVRQKGEIVEIFYLDLLKEEFIESDRFFVQQNDIIIVSPLKQRTFRRYWISNLGIITATISFAALMISLFK